MRELMNERELKLFYDKVLVPTDPEGCWIWRGALGGSGFYPRFSIKRVQVAAQRCSYTTFVGPIPKGYQTDHLCRNNKCVRPDHLEAVTAKINSQRRSAVKTHCKLNHPLSGDNLYIDPRGYRECKECRRRNVRTHRAGREVL